MTPKQSRTASLMLWGGFTLSAVCWYGLRAAWFMPALFLVVAYYGAQRLEEKNRWYRYATFTIIAAILLLLLTAAGIARGRAGAFLLFWTYAATLALSALGLVKSR